MQVSYADFLSKLCKTSIESSIDVENDRKYAMSVDLCTVPVKADI